MGKRNEAASVWRPRQQAAMPNGRCRVLSGMSRTDDCFKAEAALCLGPNGPKLMGGLRALTNSLYARRTSTWASGSASSLYSLSLSPSLSLSRAVSGRCLKRAVGRAGCGIVSSNVSRRPPRPTRG